MADKLFYNGHTYNNVGPAPCPIPGCEDGMVATSDANGVPAWWTDGCLFVMDRRESVEVPVNDWVKKVRNDAG